MSVKLIATPVLFAATANPTHARAFYEATLGLRLVADEPFALVFRTGDVPLRIQKVERVVETGYTTLGWEVADIATQVQQLTKRGVVFERYPHIEQDVLGIWQSPSGALLAWFKDPDGNLLSLTQTL